MNKIFKVVYNKTLGSWVAVNEFARGYCKNVSTKKLIASLALSGMAMGVLAQTTTVDLGTLRFDPTVSGAPTDPNGPWGNYAGEGPIVADGAESIVVSGNLNGVHHTQGNSVMMGWWLHTINYNDTLSILKLIATPTPDQLSADPNLKTPDQFKDYLAKEDGSFNDIAKSITVRDKKLINFIDPITNLPSTFTVWNSDSIKLCPNTGTGCWPHRLSVFNPNPTLNPFVNTRIATAKNGGTIDVEVNSGNIGNNNDTLNVALKSSSLFVATGSNSRINFGTNSKNLNVTFRDSIGISGGSDIPVKTEPEKKEFWYSRFKGEFTPKVGNLILESQNINSVEDYKNYNEYLISKVTDGTIKTWDQYHILYKQGYYIEKVTVLIKPEYLYNSNEELKLPVGTRSLLLAENGGEVVIKDSAKLSTTYINGNEIDKNIYAAIGLSKGANSRIINKGYITHNRGDNADGEGLIAYDGGTVINEGEMHNYSYWSPWGSSSLMASGTNSIAINRGIITSEENVVKNMYAYKGGVILNEGDIFVQNDTRIFTKLSEYSFAGMFIDNGTAASENKGNIHIGKSSKVSEPIKLHNLKVTGVLLSGSGHGTGSFINNGIIKIYEKVNSAKGIFLEGKNYTVTNNRDIEILGHNPELSYSNIGIAYTGAPGNRLTNNANIIVKGSNNIGAKSYAYNNVANYDNEFINTANSKIIVFEAIEGGLPNYGVWAEGGGYQG